jgi:predicted DsbA family dithiol-disulfide isomerase
MALDKTKFDECLADEAVRDSVQVSAQEANGLGVASTPTVFFGVPAGEGMVQVSAAIGGALPVEEFVKELDTVLGDRRTGWLSLLRFGS